MIPVSTALSDPAYYHNFTYDNNYIFKDKRGVLNGYRAEWLHLPPEKFGNNMCGGQCGKDPRECTFMKAYWNHLNSIDFHQFYGICEKFTDTIRAKWNIENPQIVFMVHEAPSNNCSERIMLHRWFRANGVEISELLFPH